MLWQWCGTESTAKTNEAGWRGFSILLYSPWQRLVQRGRKDPSSHQTAPNKERGLDTAQLMCTQGMCVSSRHCHTLLPCFGDSCPNSVLLYTQRSFAQLAAPQSHGVSRPQRLEEICLKNWLMVSLYKVLHKTFMKSSLLPLSAVRVCRTHLVSCWAFGPGTSRLCGSSPPKHRRLELKN